MRNHPLCGNNHAKMPIALKRAYEKASRSDGARVLVDRLWPRGVSKAEAALKTWLPELGPSESLRRWFHERPAQWPLFRKRYLEELASPTADTALEELYQILRNSRRVTLVFASRDEEHNNAAVLKELLEGMRKPPSSSGPVRAVAARRARVARRK